MKKLIVLILFVIIIIPLNAEMLEFGFHITDDYGVVYPDDVLHLDRFVFEIETEDGEKELLRSRYFDLGSFDGFRDDKFSIRFLYYGNLSYPYDVRIEGETGNGFVGEQMQFPVDISFKSISTDEHISVEEIGENNVQITVFPAGLMTGVPAVEMLLDWENGPNALPGSYNLNLWLTLSAV